MVPCSHWFPAVWIVIPCSYQYFVEADTNLLHWLQAWANRVLQYCTLKISGDLRKSEKSSEEKLSKKKKKEKKSR